MHELYCPRVDELPSSFMGTGRSPRQRSAPISTIDLDARPLHVVRRFALARNGLFGKHDAKRAHTVRNLQYYPVDSC